MFRHLPPTATPLSWSELPNALWAADDTIEEFRAALAGYLKVKSCFLASSGRTALFLLLNSLRAQPLRGDRSQVVLPAYTCPSLAKVILDAGLTPRLVDICPTTLAFDTAQLTTALGEGTLAVILVHPFGIPRPFGDVQQLAHSVGALVIEDTAQSMGAKIGDRYAGTLGDYGLFSLGPGKPMSTGGGGIVCTNDEDAAAQLASVWEELPASTGTASVWAAARLGLFTMAFHPTGWWFAAKAGAHRVGDNEASWGYALRGLTRAQATVGQALLPRLDVINAERRMRAEELMAALQRLTHVTIPGFGVAEPYSWPSGVLEKESAAASAGHELAEVQPIFLRLPLITANHDLRERLYEALWKEGIGAGRMYRKRLDEFFPELGGGGYPGAAHVARCMLTLPTHHYLDGKDVKRIAQIVHRVDSA